jgi:5-methylcytosine-specific restriction endonuclease McrBC GTP-binding regulatory subunit McrB
VQAQHERDHETYKHGLSDRLLLVLLDEMNLAHVEQYFSDLLSRLEQRRGESRDITLDIDLGAGMPPYPLRLGRNVLWVGTMNEDETTKALSDKVVDRSNLLYFPRPRELHSRTEVTLGPESPLLAESAWREWLQLRSPFTSDELKPFKEGLQEINSRLEYVGRALGHRVWQSVEYYMANHPEVIDARARQDADALQRTLRRAYEDQLVLKVMPKLRGIETTGDSKRNCLDPIRKQLDSADMGLGLSDDFDIACRVGHGAFVWNSARYLENAE